jgi:hypothetical protein
MNKAGEAKPWATDSKIDPSMPCTVLEKTPMVAIAIWDMEA